jgi:tetratricopeptide (TPR) repeat protein
MGARDLAQLAGLYLQRARETGNNEDLVRAEAAASRSASHRLNRNTAALQVLADAQLAQHRFRASLQTTERLIVLDPDRRSFQALHAEIEMELGLYASARRDFAKLAGYGSDLSVSPRLARWAELQGDPERAHTLLARGREAIGASYGAPPEQIAWFDLRLGDLALRNGRLGEAESSYRDGLSASPGDYRLLAAMARLNADRHDWHSAIQFGEQAIETALDPATLGVIGDAYAALGDSARADEYYRVMEVAVSKQPGSYHRAWSLFLLDHDRDVDGVLRRTAREMGTRQDIYGYDLLAWALHHAGRDREAWSAMGKALELGTRDASLHFHAGMIALALHDSTAAHDHLSLALEINPYFHPSQPVAARTVLEAVSRKP